MSEKKIPLGNFSGSTDFSVPVELTLGHLRYHSTDVPLQQTSQARTQMAAEFLGKAKRHLHRAFVFNGKIQFPMELNSD